MKAIISYDLRQPNTNYDGLYEALTETGANRLLHSVWEIETPKGCGALFDELFLHLDDNDGLLVVELGADFTHYALQNPPQVITG